jgi:uncharacterized membrane protein
MEAGPMRPGSMKGLGMDAVVRSAAVALEITGAAAILIGAIVASANFVRKLLTTDFSSAYRAYRADLGRGILLGLELLVAGDILSSVVIAPTLEGLAVLAGIILIRTFLSVSLEVEINGHWPWEATRLTRRSKAD